MDYLIASPTQMAYKLRDLELQVTELTKEIQRLKESNGKKTKKNK